MLHHNVYSDAFEVCIAQSDYARGLAFAKLALDVKIFCQGPEADRMRIYDARIEAIRNHMSAGRPRNRSRKRRIQRHKTRQDLKNGRGRDAVMKSR